MAPDCYLPEHPKTEGQQFEQLPSWVSVGPQCCAPENEVQCKQPAKESHELEQVSRCQAHPVTPTSTASLTSQRAALHMRGGAFLLQRSAHATRGAQCHYLPFRRAASPPLRPRPSAARNVRTECAKTEGARTGGQTAPTALDQSRDHVASARAPPRRLPASGRLPAGAAPAQTGAATGSSWSGAALPTHCACARARAGCRANGTRSMPGRAQANAKVLRRAPRTH